MSIPVEFIPASTLQHLHQLRAERLSLRAIAAQLDQDAIPPPHGRKGWNHMLVKECLEHPPPPAEQPPAPAAQPSLKLEIHGRYTATDLHLWRWLVNQVGDELTERKPHTRPLPVVYHALKVGKGSPTRNYLWETLKRLVSIRIFWDGKLGEKRTSVFATLLGAGRITDDKNVLAFEFSPSLVKLLKIPQENARIQLLLDSKKGEADA